VLFYKPQIVICNDVSCDMCFAYYVDLWRTPERMDYVAELAAAISGHYQLEMSTINFEALYHDLPLSIVAYDEGSRLRSFRIAN
jgi:hypothetical protein